MRAKKTIRTKLDKVSIVDVEYQNILISQKVVEGPEALIGRAIRLSLNVNDLSTTDKTLLQNFLKRVK